MSESDADMIPVEAGEPDMDAPAADPEAESVSAGEPGDALREWADALEARDWATARAMWGDDGQKSGLSPEEFASALALIEAHPDEAARLITSRQPLANTEAAFDSLAGNAHEIKILIDPNA